MVKTKPNPRAVARDEAIYMEYKPDGNTSSLRFYNDNFEFKRVVSDQFDYRLAIFLMKDTQTGRNISKNTTIKIPAHNIPAFKPAKTFTEGVKSKVVVK